MFLKTEQFEYNGVSVTLSELSALQRFDYIKFVQTQNNRRQRSMMSCTLTSDIWKRHPACGDVAMAFPFPQRHSGLSEQRDAADPP